MKIPELFRIVLLIVGILNIRFSEEKKELESIYE